LISVLGHEHELGSSFRLTLNPETPEELVLLDIPRWDFDWQFNYYPVENITLKPGDLMRIECSWDRSLRDPELEPAYVLWADGTDDEMCFATATVREGSGS
ncbi:MAG: YceI family protein, partial [Gaiellaceae bacterium]